MIELNEHVTLKWVERKDGRIDPVDLQGHDGAVVVMRLLNKEDGEPPLIFGIVQVDDKDEIVEYKIGAFRWIPNIASLRHVESYCIVGWVQNPTSMECSIAEVAALAADRRRQEESEAANE